ncbi:hypothetical protein BDV37DRAFT_123330 [Aspergillus pseudonomiae]|uniref:Nucleoporin NUP37 n=1 Tax=Aspergillus pseudonomiae TaxID=1506151 RepID=A0A5N7DC65_9EURO|nr:uncharacterized protein BDV37DRAFT_123330 [Aspergillus pseudonomiae]KAE8403829.1 hypothetical protein BDV37DRAFT_123330 [Aspergillus pseudonomiae]
MPSFPSRPLARSRDDGLQLSYQLPHRVYTAKGYPVLAPNGSSIIIYGYENGLKVIWRGGRPFTDRKPSASKDQPQEKTNRSNDDSIMIIDSDDESSVEPQKNEEPSYGFEEDEPEIDPLFPYENVLRQIDIPLGTRVVELAVPRILPESSRSSLDPFPPILRKYMVISAVCADLSTQVVTLPLAPPHPTQFEISSWVQTLSISGGVSHQEIPRGVGIAFTYQASEPQGDEDMTQSQSGSNRHRPGRWDLLVATHSAESSGLLIIHRIPVVEETDHSEVLYRLGEDDIESKRRYLPAPAQNIAFNPSPYPSPRHSTLLVAFHSGCVKVYSCFSMKPSKASRRSSSPQNDFETSETDGKWLISLYPGFEQSPSGLPRRKTIVNAEWVLGGRAIMVLMADGEWGVWDLEGAGPGTIKGPLQRQSSVQGVTGGSLTAFSVSGRILSPLSGARTETGGPIAEQRPKFAPLTPHTKRVREDTLLKGAMVGSIMPSLCGEISVYQTNSYRDSLPDESILLRHGNQSAVIPSLLSLWRNAVKATGTFDASNRCRVSAIQDITLMGEHLKGIGHLPAASRQTRQAEGGDHDALLVAEHRIIVLTPRLNEPDESPALLGPVNETPTAETDQLKLRRGELDVEGMDRLLSGMASGNQSLRMGSPIKRARIFT